MYYINLISFVLMRLSYCLFLGDATKHIYILFIRLRINIVGLLHLQGRPCLGFPNLSSTFQTKA